MKKVVIAWGGWSCTLGYIRWAYVAEYVEGQPVNTILPGSEKIGKNLFDAPYRKEITDPKNCNYGKEPAPFPIGVCKKWITDNGYLLMTRVKMRTD